MSMVVRKSASSSEEGLFFPSRVEMAPESRHVVVRDAEHPIAKVWDAHQIYVALIFADGANFTNKALIVRKDQKGNEVLREMTPFELLRAKVDSKFRNQETEKVRKVVTLIMQQMTHEDVDTWQSSVLSLDSRYFDRTHLPETFISALSRRRFGKEYVDLTNIEKALFCYEELGIYPKKGKGFSDSYIIEDMYGEKLGIFKPGFGEPMSLSHPDPLIFLRNVILYSLDALLCILGTIPSMVSGQGYIAEKVTKDTSDAIGQRGLVSETCVMDMRLGNQKVRGSFQAFDKGKVEELAEFLGTGKKFTSPPNQTNLDKVPQGEWLYLGMLHYILGNIDGHAENILVYPDKEQSDTFHLLAIDGGMSFGEHLFHTSQETEKFLMWLHHLPVQDLKFGPEHLEMLDNISKAIEQNAPYYQDQKSFQKRLKCVQIRISVLKKCILLNQPLGKLLELKTSTSILEFLSMPMPKVGDKADIAKQSAQKMLEITKRSKTKQAAAHEWNAHLKEELKKLKHERFLVNIGVMNYSEWKKHSDALQDRIQFGKILLDKFDTVEELHENLANHRLFQELLFLIYSNTSSEKTLRTTKKAFGI